MVNGRFLLYDDFQLDLHLAISSYLAKENFKFIYYKKKYLNKDKTKFITLEEHRDSQLNKLLQILE
jgi:hypothetical protein